MIKKNCFLLLLFCVFLFSCEKKVPLTTDLPKQVVSGIVLTFDDAYIDEWYNANQRLKKYSWKATFCVSRINTLDTTEIHKLLELQQEGHEIAGHGLNHVDARKYVKQNGIKSYINNEIKPMKDLFHFYSFNLYSFAYPFGFRTAELDKALSHHFKIIRATVYGEKKPSLENCFYNSKYLVYGISIDENKNFNRAYIFKLLDYAYKNHKILIVYGHKPVFQINGTYQTRGKTLELICKYIQEHQMKFYTLSQLSKLKS
jgi:peptidoglycan/xylan/chitin deacetylase (PgdA/CDA1 family)